MKTATISLVLFFSVTSARAQDPATCPMHAAHQAAADHHAKVNERGDHVMGFDHAKTAHHFRLAKDGGSIEVTATDKEDTASINAVRTHLAEIARLFPEGKFDMPMMIHDRVPPGVPVMTRLKSEIRYAYEPVERGGRVLITTANAEALAAVHDFLRFQIEDHATGDPLTVEGVPPSSSPRPSSGRS